MGDPSSSGLLCLGCCSCLPAGQRVVLTLHRPLQRPLQRTLHRPLQHTLQRPLQRPLTSTCLATCLATCCASQQVVSNLMKPLCSDIRRRPLCCSARADDPDAWVADDVLPMACGPQMVFSFLQVWRVQQDALPVVCRSEGGAELCEFQQGEGAV